MYLVLVTFFFFFFFSSRRRHTRSKRDWSSDVCSSDLQLNSSFDQAMTALARDLHQQGKDDEARQWVDKALQVNPKDLKAWYQKGWMSITLEPDVAIAAFEKALVIQPSFALAHRDLGIL